MSETVRDLLEMELVVATGKEVSYVVRMVSFVKGE